MPNGFKATIGWIWNWWIGSIPPPAAIVSSLAARLEQPQFAQWSFGTLSVPEVGREPSR